MTTLDKMIDRTRLELRDVDLLNADGNPEPIDTVEDPTLETLINEQLLFLTHGRVDPVTGTAYTLATLPDIEVPLLAMATAIAVLWQLATEASREIDVTMAEGIHLPEGQRYQQLMNHIAVLQKRFDEMASMLNIGINRIEMLTLRRVSRTTGRLVPVYVPQEYDDITYPPVRIYPPIDSGLT